MTTIDPKKFMQLVWARYRGRKDFDGGCITHVQNDAGRIACDAIPNACDVGISTLDREWNEPSCKRCQRAIARGFPLN